ncbi:MarR family transcriptional regulator, partial [Actinocorallia lasiicapitis]
MIATPATVREGNALTVLEALCDGPAQSRAGLARRLGMAKPTMGNALDLLLAAGLVKEVAPPEGPHYGALFFEPDYGIGRVLGLDIGRRFVRGAVADLGGKVIARHAVPVSASTA